MTDLDSTALRTLFAQDPDPACLSAAERERMEGFASPVRRSQFLLGRTALRHLAAAHLGCIPAKVPLGVAATGAPLLTGTPFHLSLSHSGNGALAALAACPVGCDLEAPPRRERDLQALSLRFFAPEEARILETLEPPARSASFLAMWTRKEAAYKSGAVAWPQALATAWRDGDNAHSGGILQVRVPPGLPAGWTGRVAMHQPFRSPAASTPA